MTENTDQFFIKVIVEYILPECIIIYDLLRAYNQWDDLDNTYGTVNRSLNFADLNTWSKSNIHKEIYSCLKINPNLRSLNKNLKLKFIGLFGLDYNKLVLE